MMILTIITQAKSKKIKAITIQIITIPRMKLINNPKRMKIIYMINTIPPVIMHSQNQHKRQITMKNKKMTNTLKILNILNLKKTCLPQITKLILTSVKEDLLILSRVALFMMVNGKET